MKHKIFKTLFVVVAATMTFCAEADTMTVNGMSLRGSDPVGGVRLVG